MATPQWWPLALASVVTATLASIVVFRSLAGDDGSAAAVPTAPATATATAVPSPVSETEPVLEKRIFPYGQTVDVGVRNGIGFLDAATGDIEAWYMPTQPEYTSIAWSPDGALLFHSFFEPEYADYVIERATGTTYRLRQDLRSLPHSSHGTTFLVVHLISPDKFRAAILDLKTGNLTDLGLESVKQDMNAFIAPDGRRVAVKAGSRVAVVDIVSRVVKEVAMVEPFDSESLIEIPGGLGFALTPQSTAGRPRWFTWDGLPIVDVPAGDLSPNGRYLAEVATLGGSVGAGMGATPSLSYVTIREAATGKALLRLFSASRPAWTPQGDAIVVTVREGARVVSLSGETLATVPDENHSFEPTPSPTISGLLGTNHGTIVNYRRGTTIEPVYKELPWSASWSAKPGELVVRLSVPGKGRDWPRETLPYEARTNVREGVPGVRVVSAAGCVALRESPSSTARSVSCLPDAAPARVTEVDDPTHTASDRPPRRVAAVATDFETVLVHISAGATTSGWLPAESLAWE